MSPARGKTRYLILGLLATEGPLSGYDIKRLTEVRLRYFWSESFGQIYPELKLLAAEKLIEVLPDSSRPAKRAKIRYGVTESGRRVLRDWLREPAETETNRYEVLLKVYFGAVGDRSVTRSHIELFRARYEPLVEQLAAFDQQVSRIAEEDPDHLHVLLAIRFGRKVYDAYLSWAAEAEALLAEE
ncbi:PadR family transcriptional regulator [Salinispira pacifica]